MRVEAVKQLSPLQRFLYWVRERYMIALRRRAGKMKPWTDDEILQRYFFTHPYREMDKVTVWFRENVRDPLRNDPRVLFATVAFRWFNWPPTARILMGVAAPTRAKAPDLLTGWDATEALRRLRPYRDSGTQVFTGAYMINSPAGEPKLEAILRRITNVWKEKDRLLDEIGNHLRPENQTMQGVHKLLTVFDGMGGFMAYEVVCDLRYTYLLREATDKLTWCNIGPGARRGLYRVLGLDFPKGNNAAGCPKLLSDKDEMREMKKLLAVTQKRFLKSMPAFEMREIEHSCCEVDKYERLLWGDGKSKRTYPGVK